MPQLTDTEKKTANKEASDALTRCKTAADVKEVWAKHYLTIGHRALGRLLIGTVTETGEKKAPDPKKE